MPCRSSCRLSAVLRVQSRGSLTVSGAAIGHVHHASRPGRTVCVSVSKQSQVTVAVAVVNSKTKKEDSKVQSGLSNFTLHHSRVPKGHSGVKPVFPVGAMLCRVIGTGARHYGIPFSALPFAWLQKSSSHWWAVCILQKRGEESLSLGQWLLSSSIRAQFDDPNLEDFGNQHVPAEVLAIFSSPPKTCFRAFEACDSRDICLQVDWVAN